MCGRYSLIAELSELAARFEFDVETLAHASRYNIAPTQDVLAVHGAPRRASAMRWGLVPWWTAGAPSGPPLINARVESVEHRPAFRDALTERRCLVLADGFYEWRGGDRNQPVCVTLASGEPFAFAGLWDSWRRPDGEQLLSCAIITTAPNALMRSIHDRMPAILPREHERLWLDPGLDDPDALLTLLAPYPSREMAAVAVSTRVNSHANDGPELLSPPEQPPLL